MRNKKMIISFAALILLSAYMLLTHHLIYKRISWAGLKAADAKGEYTINDMGNGKIIYSAIGDSLTSGVGVANYEESYPYLLAQKISPDGILLHDRAYPGARTSDVIKSLLEPAINDQPDVVTILIGVNDIHGLVSKKTFTENYTEIIRRLKTETKAKIYAINIPFIGTDSLLLPPYNSYFKRETIEFNKIIKRLSEENDIKYIDLFTPTERMFENPDFYASDSFHPSAKGYKLWSDIIYADYSK